MTSFRLGWSAARIGALAWVLCVSAACGGDDDGGSGEPLGGTGGGGSAAAGITGGSSGTGGAGSGGSGGSTPTGMAGMGGSGGSGGSSAGSGGSSGSGGSGGSSGSGGDDAGVDAGTDSGIDDPCADLPDACDTAGTSCDGDTLVTCEEDADGCLVETTEDCTDGSTDFCDDTPDPAECAACPATDCTGASATCDGETLVVCAENANGCLVETSTDCTAGSTDFCDEDAATPACEACAATTCSSAGTSCNGITLITCTEDADGCLDRTTTDCTTVDDDNYCGDSPTPAACVKEPCRNADGTAKDNVCVVDETMCDGDVLIECVPDVPDGCPIATQTDCNTMGNNTCNPETLSCDFDPCKGVTDCTVEGVTCRGSLLVTCAPNVDDCLVEDPYDCTQDGTVNQTCDPEPATPVCADCIDDAACVGKVEDEMTCDVDNVLTTCIDSDGNGCLEAVVEDCGADFTCEAGGCQYSGGDTCTEDVESEHVLRGAGSYGPFMTSTETNQYGNYVCPGFPNGFPFVAASPDILFALEVPAQHAIEVSFTGVTGFGASGVWMVSVDGCADSGGTQVEATCNAFSERSLSYTNEGTETVRVYLIVDADDLTGGADNTGTFGLEVDARPLGCGDGKRDGGEDCDDGNVIDGDGCNDCVLETGWACTGLNPSVCTRRPPANDYVCGNVQCNALPTAASNAGAVPCCTIAADCGIAYAPMYGASCLPRDQPGAIDTECGDEVPPGLLAFFAPQLDGCCRPTGGGNGECGLTAANGAGCVERTEVWNAMLDGAGSSYYDGPFLADTCTP